VIDVEIVVVPVEVGVVDVVGGMVADVEVEELEDGATELLVPVVELAELVRLIDEVVILVPPDDGAEAR